MSTSRKPAAAGPGAIEEVYGFINRCATKYYRKFPVKHQKISLSGLRIRYFAFFEVARTLRSANIAAGSRSVRLIEG